ncbi:D-galactarate dehydratase [Roseicyclus mahoneyensis]|uniref:D-galactarate dehydratase/altronate hydrolase n=1 Tax=Roseicyclus mahoneyensis TaxID=164332 RepID=A0A316GHC5_9RHOB|nr:D-galactarate dehydratase [Roseicyclus mahoneyensis]PWK59577.1 hypothetical protein C7455_107122 [Roseicyclus mahoneyensis]
MKHAIAFLSVLALGACATAPEDPAPQITALDPTETVEGGTGAGLPDGEGRFMGFTVASLGDAATPGLWIETPLVTSEQPGRVVSENGMQLFLTLRPSGGARNSGSRLSLQAFQELGIPLTALPTVTVISDA